MAINFDKYLYSTGTHYISNSGKDENSGTKGGKAGDQTGHEWELKKWYDRPWTVILRYPDQSVALTIAQLSIAAALNDKIGYDQGQRTTYWKQLQAAGYNPSAITTACEEDCTAGVSANVKAAGYIHGIKKLEDLPICSSRNMRKEFVNAGFIALTDSKYLSGPNYLLPGDILLFENHHAAANVTLGSKVRDQWFPENQPDKPVTPDDDPDEWNGTKAVITGNSVNVRPLPTTDCEPYTSVNKGVKLPCLGKSFDDGWYAVNYKNKTGWVSAKYARAEE